MADRMSDSAPNIYVNSNEGTMGTNSCSKLDTPSLGISGSGPPSLANRMLALLSCAAKDAVIMLSLPHVIDWEHGVEGAQAVTTKDRARGGARSLSV